MIRQVVIAKDIPIIKSINCHIETFNQFLADKYKIDLFDENQLDDDSYLHMLNNKTWQQISFPRYCDEPGVYFFFGYSTTNKEKICVYAGKASLASTTGDRLWWHFNKAFDEDGQIFKINNGERFNIEAVIIIPLGQKGLTVISSALEEHLLVELSKDKSIHKLYIRGNHKNGTQPLVL